MTYKKVEIDILNRNYGLKSQNYDKKSQNYYLKTKKVIRWLVEVETDQMLKIKVIIITVIISTF